MEMIGKRVFGLRKIGSRVRGRVKMRKEQRRTIFVRYVTWYVPALLRAS